MNIVEIDIDKTIWRIKSADSKKVAFEIVDKSDLLVLKEKLLDLDIEGGVIKSEHEIILNYTQEVIEPALWLTEQLNCPFVYGEKEQFSEKSEEQKWLITYHGYQSGKDEYSVESLLTVGNGFLGLRGTTPEMTISEEQYPATYLAGCYNSAASDVSGQTIWNEDFVNVPNLQKIYLRIDDEDVRITSDNLITMKRTLHLKTGLFQSWCVIETKAGKRILIHTRKFANMAKRNQYHLLYEFTPLNFSGEIVLISEADGDVFNFNVERYRRLTKHHLDIETAISAENRAELAVKTKQSGITVRQMSNLFSEHIDLSKMTCQIEEKKIFHKIKVSVQQGTKYQLEKSVFVEQFKENETIPPSDLRVKEFEQFNQAYADTVQAWQMLWDKAALTITGDFMSQKLLNLHTYHLLVSASPNGNKGLDASITARGLHGEAYRGHVFWDELFILPFYMIHFPDTAKELLLYRYRRLNAARLAARQAGYKGAMFPWQSGLDGTEQSQKLHLNPLSGEWEEDRSHLQRHVSLAIAYNVWQYWNVTQDISFMQKYGLEMILDIARFWLDKAEWDGEKKRYSINHVMGPDEFHEGYPGSVAGGLKNNAYTNFMVSWLFNEIENLQSEIDVFSFTNVQNKLGLTADELVSMQNIRQQLQLEIDAEGIIAQFEGYFKLKEIDWTDYKKNYQNIYRMDRILKAEGKSADAYKVAKQADSLMIFNNFSTEQVTGILASLGYHLPDDYVEKNLDYYLKRTSHGSTLSRIVHAQLAAMVGNKKLAWELFAAALYSDYRDIQGGTTAEGIHTGVMAATLFTPIAVFAGVDIRQERLSFLPNMPSQWSSLQFRMTHRHIAYQIYVDHTLLKIKADAQTTIFCGTQKYLVNKDEEKSIIYREMEGNLNE